MGDLETTGGKQEKIKMDKIQNPPAFPRSDGGFSPTQDGMSMRDYFAANAPRLSIFIVILLCLRSFKSAATVISEWNYNYADAMLVERTKRTP